LTWRHHLTDPNAEAERLRVTTIIARLGWSVEELARALDAAPSEEAFKTRVRRSLLLQVEAYDPPRLMNRTGSGTTPFHSQSIGSSTRTQRGNLHQEPEMVRESCGRRVVGGGDCCEEHMIEARRIEERASRRERLAEARETLRRARERLRGRIDVDKLDRRLEAEEVKAA
jgi:hypothetical protein